MKNQIVFLKNNNNIINLIITKFIGVLIVLINVKLLNVQFTEKGYGVYVILISIIQLFTVFGHMSYPIFFLKKISANFKNTKFNIVKEYETAFTIIVFFSGFIFLLMLLFSKKIAFFYDINHNNNLIQKIAFVIPILSLRELNTQVLRAFKKSNHFQVLSSVLTQFLILICLSINFFYELFYFQTLISFYIFFEVVSLLASFHYLIKFNIKFSFTIALNNLVKVKDSFAFFSSRIISVLFNFLTIILLSKFALKKDVGGYNIIMKYIALTTILIDLTNIYIAPTASRLFNNGEYLKLNSFLKKNNLMILGVNLPIILFFFFFPKFMLNLFGDYGYLSEVFIIILIAYIVNMLCGSIGLILQMVGFEKVYRNILFMSLLLYAIIGYLFAYEFQFIGIIIGRSLALVLWNIIGVIYLYKKVKIKTFIHV